MMNSELVEKLAKLGKGSTVPVEEKSLKDFFPDLITTKKLPIKIIDSSNSDIQHQFYLEDPLPKLVVKFQKPVPVPKFEIIENKFGSQFEAITPYKRYVEATEDELQQRVEYDMDEQDRCWLTQFNKRSVKLSNKPCSMELFEYLMDQLEKEWFLLVKDVPKEAQSDLQYPEEGTCAVCDDAEAENSNAIVFCDGCNIAVHQDCYGIPFIPEGQWLCRKCMVAPGKPVSCVLCPSKEGAFKQTNTNKWCHLLCAICLPECHVQNTIYMEPIEGIKDIPKNRWKLTCYICQKRQGAPIQCSAKNCFTAFHPTCARAAKLPMRLRGLDISEQNQFRAYCDKHAPKEHREKVNLEYYLQKAQYELSRTEQVSYIEDDENDSIVTKIELKNGKQAIRRISRKQVSMSNPIIPNYILSRLVADENELLPKKRLDLIVNIARYWSLKKEGLRGAALLKRLHLEPWTAHASASNEEDEAKAHKYEVLSLVRRDLEKVRLMLDIVRKRERYKLRIYKAHREIFETAVYPMNSILQHWLGKFKLLDKQLIFAEPVQVEYVPDYLTVIKNPMDFKTMETKLRNYEYQHLDKFISDLQLITQNCMTYNSPETIFYKAARKLEINIQMAIPMIKKQFEESNLELNGHWKTPISQDIIKSIEDWKFLEVDPN